VRKTGLGEVAVIVDVWCGGYQNPHAPVTIGWRASTHDARSGSGGSVIQGIVLVADYPDQAAAIESAKLTADAALQTFEGSK
jgi:hypothetical protein